MFEYLVFFLFAAIAVIFSVMMILHRNPVVSALAMVVAFFALAVIYVLLGVPFMAALQVIIYAGAIMVLFLFVIMLLNLQALPEERPRAVQNFLGWFAGAGFAITLVFYLLKGAYIQVAEGPFQADVHSIGYRLFEAYLFPFEMVSILLLAAIVGALIISQRRVVNTKAPELR
jgi:NADH-quinone oxidoreductase subunit J